MKSIRVLTLVLISFIEKGGHHDLVLAIRYNGYGPLILLWDLFFFGQYYISTKKIGTPVLQSQINLKDWSGNRNPFRNFFLYLLCKLCNQRFSGEKLVSVKIQENRTKMQIILPQWLFCEICERVTVWNYAHIIVEGEK